jgi:hypothetical protein
MNMVNNEISASSIGFSYVFMGFHMGKSCLSKNSKDLVGFNEKIRGVDH